MKTLKSPFEINWPLLKPIHFSMRTIYTYRSTLLFLINVLLCKSNGCYFLALRPCRAFNTKALTREFLPLFICTWFFKISILWNYCERYSTNERCNCGQLWNKRTLKWRLSGTQCIAYFLENFINSLESKKITHVKNLVKCIALVSHA